MEIIKNMRNLSLEDSIAFGQWFRQQRKALGLSMEKIARGADCATQTILHIEQGKGGSSTTLCKALDAIGYKLIIVKKGEGEL